jgi:hypothetical protein
MFWIFEYRVPTNSSMLHSICVNFLSVLWCCIQKKRNNVTNKVKVKQLCFYSGVKIGILVAYLYVSRAYVAYEYSCSWWWKTYIWDDFVTCETCSETNFSIKQIYSLFDKIVPSLKIVQWESSLSLYCMSIKSLTNWCLMPSLSGPMFLLTIFHPEATCTVIQENFSIWKFFSDCHIICGPSALGIGQYYPQQWYFPRGSLWLARYPLSPGL